MKSVIKTSVVHPRVNPVKWQIESIKTHTDIKILKFGPPALVPPLSRIQSRSISERVKRSNFDRWLLCSISDSFQVPGQIADYGAYGLPQELPPAYQVISEEDKHKAQGNIEHWYSQNAFCWYKGTVDILTWMLWISRSGVAFVNMVIPY